MRIRTQYCSAATAIRRATHWRAWKVSLGNNRGAVNAVQTGKSAHRIATKLEGNAIVAW